MSKLTGKYVSQNTDKGGCENFKNGELPIMSLLIQTELALISATKRIKLMTSSIYCID